jgi:hypothetical protein
MKYYFVFRGDDFSILFHQLIEIIRKNRVLLKRLERFFENNTIQINGKNMARRKVVLRSNSISRMYWSQADLKPFERYQYIKASFSDEVIFK